MRSSRRPAATAVSAAGSTARPRSSCSTRRPTSTATARSARATSASCGSPASTRRRALNDMTYSRLIQGLKAAGVEVDRKVLADLAVNDAAGLRRARRGRPRRAADRRHRRPRGRAEAAQLPDRHHLDPLTAGPGSTTPDPALGPRGRAPVRRRGPAGGPRGAARRCSSCTPTRTAQDALRRPARRGARARSPPVSRDGPRGDGRDGHAAGRCSASRRCSTSPSRTALAGAPRLVAVLEARQRPGQRRHGHPHRRRRRRRRGRAHRRLDRPAQRQVRAGHRRQPVAPAGRARRRRWPTPSRRCARRACRCSPPRGARRRRPRRPASTRARSPRPTAWLLGNEAAGLSDEALALADRTVRIPIHGRAESLNLATAAAAVCLYASARAHRDRRRVQA